MVIISDLNKCVVDEVIIDGEVVAKDNKLIKEFKPYSYPESAKHTVHLDKIEKNQQYRIHLNLAETTNFIWEVNIDAED